MINKNIMRVIAYTILFVTILISLGSFVYTGYASNTTKLYSFFASLGYFWLVLWFILGLPSWILSKIINKAKVFYSFITLYISAIIISLVVDLIVFSQYRFHVNAAMIDLFLHGGKTISFSTTMWIELIGITLLIVTGSGLIIFAASKMNDKFKSLKPFNYSLLAILLVTQTIYMFAASLNHINIISSKEYLPLFYPLQATKFMDKIGFTAPNDKIKIDFATTRLNYPLNKTTFAQSNEPRKNIIFLLSDSLRAEYFNEDVMPFTWKWAQDKMIFENHFSPSNCTRTGIFSLFYSLPPSYWHPFFSTETAPIFITHLQELGYDIQAFATAPLDHPEFTETVFASVKDLRIGSNGNTVADADMNSFDDFNKYLVKRDETGDKRPFMAFVFYDAPHAFQYGEGCEKFQPAWKEMNYIGLNNSTEKLPVINLYKNSIYYIDKLFGKSLEALKEHNLIDNSIIIVSSDHSQEMNDSGKNFWGHNSAFTDAQTKVPLIIHWPGKQSFKEERRTAHYDIVPTLLEEEFNLTSDKSDFCIGLNLFKDKIEDRKWFIMGSYSKTAIKEEDRIIEINGIGLINFYDNKYDQHPDTTRTHNIYESLKLMSKFLK